MSKTIHSGRTRDGWLFVSPALVLLVVFLVFPVVMAAWVSVSDWRGVGNPFSGDTSFVGAENYQNLLTGGSLQQRDFGTSLRNNAYYVLFVVPLQTALALALAVFVHAKALRGRGFFRTAFYFPSVTSSVAITVLWLFLFSTSGVVNNVLGWVGINGPNWFSDPRGVIHVVLGWVGVDSPGFLTDNTMMGVSLWEWVSGPSFAMTAFILLAVFTTSGTFMLLFIAALNNLSEDVDEAGMIDGANGWQRFWHITLPMLKPTLFTVLTLGLIGTWQLFDQIYTAGDDGGPAKTTLTPAFLLYQTSFNSQRWGEGAAIAFILFGIIVLLTAFQRWVLRERS